MQAFLEAAGVVVLILVALLLVAGVLVGLAVFRPILAQVGEATLGSVPAEIELVPVDDGAWPDAELRERLRAALEREGFVSCGTYRIDPLEKQWVTLLVGADRGSSAAVLNHPLAGTWVDLWAIDRDGRTLTHTTCPGAGALARAPWSRRVVRPRSADHEPRSALSAGPSGKRAADHRRYRSILLRGRLAPAHGVAARAGRHHR